MRTSGVMAEGLGSWWGHCCSGGTSSLVGRVMAVGLQQQVAVGLGSGRLLCRCSLRCIRGRGTQ